MLCHYLSKWTFPSQELPPDFTGKQFHLWSLSQCPLSKLKQLFSDVLPNLTLHPLTAHVVQYGTDLMLYLCFSPWVFFSWVDLKSWIWSHLHNIVLCRCKHLNEVWEPQPIVCCSLFAFNLDYKCSVCIALAVPFNILQIQIKRCNNYQS